MDYFQLHHRFFKAHEQARLSAAETALYWFLLAECNRLRWKNPFSYTNAALCDRISVSEKTLIAARARLQQQGLLTFKSGFKHHPTQYQLTSASVGLITQDNAPSIFQPNEQRGKSISSGTLEIAGSSLHEEVIVANQNKTARPRERASSDRGKQVETHNPCSADDSPLANREAFVTILRKNGYGHVDMDIYCQQMLSKALDKKLMRSLSAWTTWIVTYLNNERQRGPLLLPPVPETPSASNNLRTKADTNTFLL